MTNSVFLAFNESFARYAAVSIASLLVHARSKLSLTCIVSELEPCSERLIRDLVERFDGKVEFIRADESFFAGWKLGFHFTISNYFRLLGPSLIRAERALFLDADLIITCDVDDLTSVDLQSCWFGGCIDHLGGRASGVPRSPNDPYLNAGVLIYNLNALRKFDFLRKCRDVYISYQDSIKFADQCIINKLAEGRKLPIDERWNIQINDRGPYDLKNRIGGFEGRSIIHANGPIKPWMTWSDPWISELWFSYARLVDLSPAEFRIEPRNVQELYAQARARDLSGDYKSASEIKERLLKILSNQNNQASTP
jgi:lipopolysaccharide biosynthesis glycosyltransferase